MNFNAPYLAMWYVEDKVLNVDADFVMYIDCGFSHPTKRRRRKMKIMVAYFGSFPSGELVTDAGAVVFTSPTHKSEKGIMSMI